MHRIFLAFLFLFGTDVLGAKPNQTCAGLLVAVSQHHQFASNSRSLNTEAMNDLRIFRLQLTQEDLRPAILKLDTSSSKKEIVKSVARELLGIEAFWRQQEGENPSRKNIVAAVKLNGRAEISEFNRDTAELTESAFRIVNGPDRITSNLRRTAQSVVGGLSLIGGVAMRSFGAENAMLFQLTGALLIATTEPVASILSTFKKDSRFELAQQKLSEFINTGKPGEWIFDSWQYRPTGAMIENLWQKGLRHRDSWWALNNQEDFDTRGIISKINWRAKAWMAGQANKMELKELIEWISREAWFGVDRLVQIDESGQPTEWLVVRFSVRRPHFPKTVKETDREPVLHLEPLKAVMPISN